MAGRFGDSVAFSCLKAPTTNGCFEVSVALPGVSSWPPPPVAEKNYLPKVGTLLWSKFNGDLRLAGPTAEEDMRSICDLIDMLTSTESGDFSAAVKAACEQRRAPKKVESKGSGLLQKLAEESK